MSDGMSDMMREMEAEAKVPSMRTREDVIALIEHYEHIKSGFSISRDSLDIVNIRIGILKWVLRED